MTEILVHLMRHGIPVQPNLLLGQRDDPPLPSGTAKCVAAAEGLAFERVISSDLSRAHIPAARIAAARGASHTVDARWRELDFGAWTGLAPAQVDPAAHARFWDDPEANAPPQGERWSQLSARVGAALAEIHASTLVLTHGGAMRAALAALFHMEHRHVWSFDLPYSCVLTLRVWPGEAVPTAQIVGLTT
ncbi:phosphoglycerate mutase [Novosphingobium barchaimii LL02]|uniref:Phosphoglycerate mutase n=1 Tax=Novosphingobium barchaimii LL02 TaxID=1114963 RepID=A0A0J7XMI9_9SPHN|nr:histidine phosphatase family protein [Novosphingobium barchaimii]KMS52902.1 phosphoglycerate mutase [Novosphingobium barchaimii LL02]